MSPICPFVGSIRVCSRATFRNYHVCAVAFPRCWECPAHLTKHSSLAFSSIAPHLVSRYHQWHHHFLSSSSSSSSSPSSFPSSMINSFNSNHNTSRSSPSTAPFNFALRSLPSNANHNLHTCVSFSSANGKACLSDTYIGGPLLSSLRNVAWQSVFLTSFMYVSNCVSKSWCWNLFVV